MSQPDPARRERRRDRHGRGIRGPLSLPGRLAAAAPGVRTRPADEFDAVVLHAVGRLRRHLPADLDAVQFGVEETPVLPDDWSGPVPLGTRVPAGRDVPARVVVYRLPVVSRARGRHETATLVLDVLVDEVADLLGRDPDDVDPR